MEDAFHFVVKALEQACTWHMGDRNRRKHYNSECDVSEGAARRRRCMGQQRDSQAKDGCIVAAQHGATSDRLRAAAQSRSAHNACGKRERITTNGDGLPITQSLSCAAPLFVVASNQPGGRIHPETQARNKPSEGVVLLHVCAFMKHRGQQNIIVDLRSERGVEHDTWTPDADRKDGFRCVFDNIDAQLREGL